MPKPQARSRTEAMRREAKQCAHCKWMSEEESVSSMSPVEDNSSSRTTVSARPDISRPLAELDENGRTEEVVSARSLRYRPNG